MSPPERAKHWPNKLRLGFGLDRIAPGEQVIKARPDRDPDVAHSLIGQRQPFRRFAHALAQPVACE